MYFSRVRIRPDHRRIAHLYQGDAYSEHQLLMSLFPADADASLRLLYRRDEHQSGVVYHLVSRQSPDPEHPVLQSESKPYQPAFDVNETLQFVLRVNPVVSRRDEDGRSHRHDIVMDHKRQIDYKDLPVEKRPSQMQLAHAAGEAWLYARMRNCGFEVEPEQWQVDAYNTHTVYQRKHQRWIHYSSMDFSGVLRVHDVATFTQALFNGIGPAKAFGCGLMMIKR